MRSNFVQCARSVFSLVLAVIRQNGYVMIVQNPGHGSDIYTNVADWKDVATLLKYSADEMNRVLKAEEPLVSDPASNRR